jgi:SAM-dependent methyltransferase
MTFVVRRILNSINYRVIGPLTGREARNWSSKTDSSKTYQRLYRELRSGHSADEAAQQAVGGHFEGIGIVMRETLIHHGLGKQDYLIDVGCGSGRLAKPLADYLDGHYLGIDVVPGLVEYARKLVPRPGWRFEVADGLTIPEEDAKADMVCFFSVLTHLLHEQSFVYLREAKRVLRPGGKIIASFLDFHVSPHWAVFEGNIKDIGVGSQPLNAFLSHETLRIWAEHLDMDVEVIKDGDDKYLPLSTPVTLDNGTVLKDRAAFGQSVCVLVRK